MAEKCKIYIMKAPFTLKEWKKGQRYILTKLTTSDVQIVYHKSQKEEQRITTETHKVLHLKSKIPQVIRMVIPEDACIVDEFSTNVEYINIGENNNAIYNIETHLKNNEGILAQIDAKKIEIQDNDNCNINLGKIVDSQSNEIKQGTIKQKQNTITSTMSIESLHSATTVYKNKHFDENTFSLEIHTIVNDKYKENSFNLTRSFKEEMIDLRTFNKKKIYNVGERDYSGEWEKRFPCIYVHKMIYVKVNSFVLGWVAGEIDKQVKNMLADVQQKIIETYDEWKDLSEEELVSLEQDMIKRFLIKIE